MARTKVARNGEHHRGSSFGERIDRLNNRLRPYIGPPPLGPYDAEPTPPTAGGTCPLCGSPMDSHEIDRSGPRTQLYCP